MDTQSHLVARLHNPFEELLSLATFPVHVQLYISRGGQRRSAREPGVVFTNLKEQHGLRGLGGEILQADRRVARYLPSRKELSPRITKKYAGFPTHDVWDTVCSGCAHETFLPFRVGEAAHRSGRDEDGHLGCASEHFGREVDGADVAEDAGAEADLGKGVGVPPIRCDA